MASTGNLPLFVLPMVLVPGEIQSLRIFEPRYRQMLDDCLLDDKPFGMIMTDPLSFHNGWNGPRTYGCEAEIISHETKGSNHFIEFVGRRRFRIDTVIDPALPPFEDESMADLIPEMGILPDLETILQRIPEDSVHSKLYLSADVTYLDDEHELTEFQQAELKATLNGILSKIGGILQIEKDALDDWIEDRTEMVIDESSASMFAVAALTISDPEYKYQLLSCSDLKEVFLQLTRFLAEMDV
ncbi:MAG: LON peptidase substrate-binding domain-containing protein [Candidatus Thermoplasmatota archaeon]|nr:LON peptidase substrate-binding domain-containing protein [Candidatus Thermoplasmatota archaeon]MEC7255024.1 LON peptidase substrate-binding domain-containing protein [Candidatus Thermoplasmatota archaeon]MEC8352856.1 LON peptidase substrate-binding domain-containing protein [Candidatus Thermoplasmatota archaeon]